MAKVLSVAQKRRELARQQKHDIQMKMGRRERTVKPTPGRSKWRILPSWKGLEDPSIGHSWGQHFVRDASDELVAVHMCMERTYGKSCPICDSLTNALRHSTDETQKILEKAKSSARFLLNAYHLDGEDPTTPVILELSPTTYEKLMDLIDLWMDEEYDETDLLDIDTGHDITITRSGKGLNTKYDLSVGPKPRKIKVDMDALHDLDEYVQQQHTETEQKALLAFDKISTGLTALPNSSQGDDMGDVLEGDFEEEVDTTPIKDDKPKTVSEADNQEIDDILGELDDLDI